MTGKSKRSYTEPSPIPLWTIGRILCAVLAGAGLAVAVWQLFRILLNPCLGPMIGTLFLLMGAAAVFINMSIAIPQNYLIRTRWLRLLAGAGKWILTAVLPFILMDQVLTFTNNRSVEIARVELAAVIDAIDHEITQSGSPPADILDKVKEVQILNTLSYFSGTDHFVLQTYGSSGDIDGVIIFYISTDRVWRRLPIDSMDSLSNEVARLYRGATEGLAKQVYWRNRKTGQWEIYTTAVQPEH